MGLHLLCLQLHGYCPAVILIEDLATNSMVQQMTSLPALRAMIVEACHGSAARTDDTAAVLGCQHCRCMMTAVLEASLDSDGSQTKKGNRHKLSKAVDATNIIDNRKEAAKEKVAEVLTPSPEGLGSGAIEQQIDCVMSLATDGNILARQWCGLQTWI